MNSKELRQNFIDYFERKEHTFARSSSVVPSDDPTLLFTNAGMNQFKDIFLDKIKPTDKRTVNSQKCIRVSGKHNDLEEVGVDDFHHTFFEMLGNWSFGDYYKKEAIEWAWEYLTENLNLDKERLWVTVYKADEEAENYWKDCTDIDPDRVLKFGDKENFWEMGDTGPCGPCSEIHYYVGDNISDQSSKGVNSSDLYRELWNLVFIQYNRTSEGELVELPVKHVDTGMGLERILSTINGIRDHYQTDLFKPIIEKIEEMSSIKISGDAGTPHRVISDHLRMLSFSIADGAMPSNEGRGYVLRRVLRRASRFGRALNFKDPFIFKLVDVLCEIMGDAFPELIDKKIHIQNVIKAEEASFLKTLDKGINIFEDIVQDMSKGDVISGKDAFKLYDTYGFPLDLTQLMAKEKEISVDIEGFETHMSNQRSTAREAGKFIQKDEEFEWILLSSEENSSFKGYNVLKTDSKIVKYRKTTNHFEYVLDITPFYAEAGGQVGDTGKFICDSYKLAIKDTFYLNNEIVHISDDYSNDIDKNNKVKAVVFSDRRSLIKCNHTATHLLHAALKSVLGDHVQQAGSLVSDDRLRFDITHYSKITDNEISEIEKIINKKIRENIKLDVSEMSFDEAKVSGAVAMFNEKYGDTVRVVDVLDFSSELCGGTHVSDTGKISLFKIISESSLSTGVRRIEAITGEKVLEYYNNLEAIIGNIKSELSCSDIDMIERIKSLINDNKSKNKEIEDLISVNQKHRIKELCDKAVHINNIKLIISKENDIKDLKSFGDKIRELSDSGTVAVIGTIKNDLPMIMCTVTKDIEDKLSAKKLISKFASIIEGGGGGRDAIATAGGKNKEKLNTALSEAEAVITELINE